MNSRQEVLPPVISESDAFLAAVCANPEDDGPRLVYADWLDERGECARAEFIRVQIDLVRMDEAGEGMIDPHEGHTCSEDPCPVCASVDRYNALRRRERELWDHCGVGESFDGYGLQSRLWWEACEGENNICRVRRGWPESVALTAAQFFGGPCGRCDGDGVLHADEPGYPCPCPVCKGDRDFRTPGLAADLARATPLTGVRLSDREPMRCGSRNRAYVYRWSRASQGVVDSSITGGLTGGPASIPSDWDKYSPFLFDEHDTRDAAHAALSRAAVALARDLAGLTLETV